MKKKILIAALAVFILAAVGTWHYFHQRQDTFYYSGNIEATKVDVPARLSTVIARILVGEGAKVRKGDRLLTLECDDLSLEHELAMQNFKRGQRLVKAGSMPLEIFEQIQSRKNEIELKQSWCKVESPIQGTVLSRYREPGEWVAPGTKLLTLADLEEVWAYIYVPEPMLSRIKVGMRVTGILPDLGMRPIEGSLIKINEEAEFTPKNVQTREERTRLVFGLKISFPNPEGLLKPGMPIEVDLPGERRE